VQILSCDAVSRVPPTARGLTPDGPERAASRQLNMHDWCVVTVASKAAPRVPHSS